MQYPTRFLIWEGILLSSTIIAFIQNGNFLQKQLITSLHVFYNFLLISFTICIIQIINYTLALKFFDDSLILTQYQSFIFIHTVLWIMVGNLASIIYYLTKEKAIKIDQKNVQNISVSNQQEAALTKLRQQINPHFLFNALNSINALMQFDIDKARQMIVNVSKYYRNTINVANENWQSLNKEIEDIQLYFEIEKIRFGHRLQMQIEVESDLNEINVPPLLFQPLVENAIKYGLYGTLGNVTITIKVYTTYSKSNKSFLTFEITNPFESETEHKPAGTGFGLNNIKNRLYIIYGTSRLLQTYITTLDNNLNEFKAFLSLPQDRNYENKNYTNR